jgi:hypothetical protein
LLETTKVKPKRKKDNAVLETRRKEACWVCGKRPADPSHITSRGAGGDDRIWNVVAKCREHHTEWHTIGWSRFFYKYPHFAMKLKAMGWGWERGKLSFTHSIGEIKGCL